MWSRNQDSTDYRRVSIRIALLDTIRLTDFYEAKLIA
jgi:hypothetical protein